jgi:hypothetical protein
MLYHFSKKPTVDYKVTKDELIEQAVWFVLLGAGIKEDAIKRYYKQNNIALEQK